MTLMQCRRQRCEVSWCINKSSVIIIVIIIIIVVVVVWSSLNIWAAGWSRTCHHCQWTQTPHTSRTVWRRGWHQRSCYTGHMSLSHCRQYTSIWNQIYAIKTDAIETCGPDGRWDMRHFWNFKIGFIYWESDLLRSSEWPWPLVLKNKLTTTIYTRRNLHSEP